MKRCSTCGEFKELSEFYPKRTAKDGLASLCKTCSNRATVKWRAANPDKVRKLAERHAGKKLAHMKTHHLRLKAKVLEHYGTCCACCGFTEDLTIDHLNGDGYEHREELFGDGRRGSAMLYRWLVRNNFPPGFQTLCRNCNSSKHRDGYCRMHGDVLPSQITPRELRDRIVAYVEAASIKGKSTVITHRGKPRAVLIPYEEWTAMKSAAS